jgi:hypothetical protein
MPRLTSRTLTAVAVAVGALLPLRPIFFTKPSDPTIEAIDLVISPFYGAGRLLPPLGDWGEIVFLGIAIVSNAALYGLITQYISRRLSR